MNQWSMGLNRPDEQNKNKNRECTTNKHNQISSWIRTKGKLINDLIYSHTSLSWAKLTRNPFLFLFFFATSITLNVRIGETWMNEWVEILVSWVCTCMSLVIGLTQNFYLFFWGNEDIERRDECECKEGNKPWFAVWLCLYVFCEKKWLTRNP